MRKDEGLLKLLCLTCDSEELDAAFKYKSACRLNKLVLASDPSQKLVDAMGQLKGRFTRLKELHAEFVQA